MRICSNVADLFMESLPVETWSKGVGEAQATFRLAQQDPCPLFLKRRGAENVLWSPEIVWKSGDNTTISGTALAPRERPGAPESVRRTGEAPSPSGRERTPTA